MNINSFQIQYTCWRKGPLTWFVVANSIEARDTLLLFVDSDGNIDLVPDGYNMNKVQMWYPCKFNTLPPAVRAQIRAFAQHEMSQVYRLKEAMRQADLTKGISS